MERISNKNNTEFSAQGCALVWVHTPKASLQSSAFEETSKTKSGNLARQALSQHFPSFQLLIEITTSVQSKKKKTSQDILGTYFLRR